MKPSRGFLLGLMMLALSCWSSQAMAAKTAQEILTEATHQAAEQHKIVFFEFGASWCSQCHRLDAFLSSPEIAPIVQKYFVLANVHFQEKEGKHPELETPGADKLMAQFGNPEGVPYIVFFDANGNAIVTSSRRVEGKKRGDNIGYPDAPEEIDWFMTMLKESVPTMNADETQQIESWLRHASSRNQSTKH